ncbi:sugar kinase [Nocardiopsis alba]|uniref:sugar kinase n=1 Tax=Nocardiopsis alba TaxID=53437 RepID=UPI0035DEAD53
MDAVCVGECMALLVPEEAPPGRAPRFRAEVGGAEGNVAVHLARAGRRVEWHGPLGDDPFGDRIRERLTASGVVCRSRIDPARPTGLYMKHPGPEGTRMRYWRRGSAASALGRDDAVAVRKAAPRLVHTTGITAALSETADELVEELLTDTSPTTLRSFDVNHRPALHDTPGRRRRLLDLARRADVVFCGLDEAQALWGIETIDGLRALIPEPQWLVVKQGATGATALRAGGSFFHPAPEVEVVEPVGAGDAFAAGFLHRLLDEAPPMECLAEGTALAGLVLGLEGDAPAPPPPPTSCDTDTGPSGRHH